MQQLLYVLLLFLHSVAFEVTAQVSARDSLSARSITKDSLQVGKKGFPVVLEADTLFYIYHDLGSFSARERASQSARKIKDLFELEELDSTAFKVEGVNGGKVIRYDTIAITGITSEDADFLKVTQEELARQYLHAIKEAGLEYHEKEVWFKKLFRIGLLILTLALFFFLFKFLNRGFNYIIHKALDSQSNYLKGVKIRDYEFISVHKEKWLILQALKIAKWILIFFLFSLSLPILFSIFPATEPLANTIFSHILNPLKRFGNALLEYIPNLFTIVIIILITRYLTRFLLFFSTEVEKGKLEIPGFFPDWARPTFNLLRVIVWIFAFIAIFPYLPGSDSAIFQGVSVFLGLLISLGSSTAIGNIIAGLVITYMRAFKIGDRVRIGEITGDVIEKTMLVTKVRTVKNEEVSIPNASILTGSTVNYTANATELGLVLHSTVTIGYDVPWRKVHELLLKAASEIEFLKKEPKPFVLQTALGDYAVRYEINAYTEQPEKSQIILSRLHANIQDAFNEANIEILSPMYSAVRDGNQTTTPKENLSPDYKNHGFEVHVKRGDPGKS